MNNIQHRVAHARADVVVLHTRHLIGSLERLEVRLGKINHVDIVPHTRAVRRVVIVAVNLQEGQLPRRNLCNIGQQVVRNAARILADQPALVRADGVEIPQDGNAPVLVREPDILEDALDHELRFAIGVGRGQREILLNRHGLGRAVDRCGRAEHNALGVVLRHQLHQIQRTEEVVAVVPPRLRDRFADRFQTRKVDCGVNVGVLDKHAAQSLLVAQIHFVSAEFLPRNFPDAIQHLRRTVDIVVRNHNVIARVQKFHRGMRADESRSPCNQNSHFYYLFS